MITPFEIDIMAYLRQKNFSNLGLHGDAIRSDTEVVSERCRFAEKFKNSLNEIYLNNKHEFKDKSLEGWNYAKGA